MNLRRSAPLALSALETAGPQSTKCLSLAGASIGRTEAPGLALRDMKAETSALRPLSALQGCRVFVFETMCLRPPDVPVYPVRRFVLARAMCVRITLCFRVDRVDRAIKSLFRLSHPRPP